MFVVYSYLIFIVLLLVFELLRPRPEGTIGLEYGPLPLPQASSRFSGLGVSSAIAVSNRSLIVGGPNDDDYLGSVWYLDFIEGRLSDKITAPPPRPSHGLFGTSVSSVLDGTSFIVGAPGEDLYQGTVYIFQQGIMTQEIRPPEVTPVSTFGLSVFIAFDGSLAVAGAPGFNFGNGGVWMFEKNGTGYYNQSRPVINPPNYEVGQSFGDYVRITADKKLLVVAATQQDGGIGRVYSYLLNGTKDATLQQELLPFNTQPGCRFGTILKISVEALVAGSPYEGCQTFLYLRSGVDWYEAVELGQQTDVSYNLEELVNCVGSHCILYRVQNAQLIRILSFNVVNNYIVSRVVLLPISQQIVVMVNQLTNPSLPEDSIFIYSYALY